MLFIKASRYTRQITQLFTYASVNSSDYIANSRLNARYLYVYEGSKQVKVGLNFIKFST